MRIFAGFGFGAIQAGLFLYEAQAAGTFGRLVVAEVVQETVDTLRRAGGYYHVNIAHADHLQAVKVGPVEIENPAVEEDRFRLIEAIAAADEIATAVPSVHSYVTEGPQSLHRVLAAGLERKVAVNGPPSIIYAAENHNRAASLLQEAVLGEVAPARQEAVRQRVAFVDTVIRKMCGVTDNLTGLQPVTPDSHRAFLVEAYNEILIAPIQPPQGAELAGLRSGFPVFHQKADLRPFEDAKLYGFNAVHAMGAYLAQLLGCTYLYELAERPDIQAFLRQAQINESGAALIKKYRGVDPLFGEAEYAAHVDDMLSRMLNPYLRDSVTRVGRDPQRKLGWDDRLIGTMRMVVTAGIRPVRYALGAAAALRSWRGVAVADIDLHASLTELWRNANPNPAEAAEILAWIEKGCRRLDGWCAAGFPNLEQWVAETAQH